MPTLTMRKQTTDACDVQRKRAATAGTKPAPEAVQRGGTPPLGRLRVADTWAVLRCDAGPAGKAERLRT